MLGQHYKRLCRINGENIFVLHVLPPCQEVRGQAQPHNSILPPSEIKNPAPGGQSHLRHEPMSYYPVA